MCLKCPLFLDYLCPMATREQNHQKDLQKDPQHPPADATPLPVSDLPVSDKGPGRGRNTVAEMPDAAPDSTGLTPRQQRILNVLRESIEKRGYPRASARSASSWA